MKQWNEWEEDYCYNRMSIFSSLWSNGNIMSVKGINSCINAISQSPHGLRRQHWSACPSLSTPQLMHIQEYWLKHDSVYLWPAWQASQVCCVQLGIGCDVQAAYTYSTHSTTGMPMKIYTLKVWIYFKCKIKQFYYHWKPDMSQKGCHGNSKYNFER